MWVSVAPMHAPCSSADPRTSSKRGWARLAFCPALALHVTDEALTGFLSVYNPTVLAIRPQGWRFPPTYEFQTWLTGLIFGVTVGFVLSPFFFGGFRWVRPVGYFLAVTVGFVNPLCHTTPPPPPHTPISP